MERINHHFDVLQIVFSEKICDFIGITEIIVFIYGFKDHGDAVCHGMHIGPVRRSESGRKAMDVKLGICNFCVPGTGIFAPQSAAEAGLDGMPIKAIPCTQS